MSNSTLQPGSRIALAAVLVGGLVVTLVWVASQITSLRRDQAEQAQRIAQTVAAVAAVPPPAPVRAEPQAASAALPQNWSEQLAAIREETRASIAKLQEQIAVKIPADAQLSTFREENRAELARLREQVSPPDQAAAKQSSDRQEQLLRSLRDQVKTLDRRTAALASSVRSNRSARLARAAKVAKISKRKRLAVYPISVWRSHKVATTRPFTGK